MAVAADGRISLSVAGQLRGATRLAGRNWGLVKFCDGEMMGKKLKLTQQVQQGSGGNMNVRRHVSMSLTADVVGELKVSNLNTHQMCALAHGTYKVTNMQSITFLSS